MGAMTSVVIGLFVAGIPTPAAITVQAYGWMGAVAFVPLLAVGWLCRRGFSFPLSFSFLTLLAQGNGLSKVQEDLVISKGTAITHRRNIYRKLDVHSRQELITYVAQFPGEGEQSLP